MKTKIIGIENIGQLIKDTENLDDLDSSNMEKFEDSNNI